MKATIVQLIGTNHPFLLIDFEQLEDPQYTSCILYYECSDVHPNMIGIKGRNYPCLKVYGKTVVIRGVKRTINSSQMIIEIIETPHQCQNVNAKLVFGREKLNPSETKSKKKFTSQRP